MDYVQSVIGYERQLSSKTIILAAAPRESELKPVTSPWSSVLESHFPRVAVIRVQFRFSCRSSSSSALPDVSRLQ